MPEASKSILVTGASGLIGRALCESLRGDGHRVFRLRRDTPTQAAADEVFWEGGDGRRAITEVTFGAVVHLAAESIMGVWTAAKKKKIRDSRAAMTRRVCEHFAQREDKPRVIVCASAIGFYGDRGDELLTEDSQAGTGFLAETCMAWEAATDPAKAAGIRVVNVRIGLVLSRSGGLLAAMLTPFKLGLGSRLGKGKHWMSWIEISDLVRAFRFLIDHDDLSGAFNATAPNPVTNAEFTKTLASVLHRPTFLPVPEFALKLIPGEMGEEALLASDRVQPRRLLDAGFRFVHPELAGALESLLSH